jgi:predicted dehydrogenase
MRMAVVGVGRIGASHAEVVRDHPAVDSVVLADADAERAQAVAQKLGVEQAPDIQTAYDQADAVVIAAATAAHPDLLLQAVRAGLPVFCEKPIAPDLAGHLRVRDEVRDVPIPIHIGFQRRFDAGYAAARAALHDGRLGELRRVHLLTGDQAPPSAAYIATSGGIFRDCHIHDFDILRWTTGHEVVEVYALGANRGAPFFGEAGDVDEAAGVLTMDDGTLVTFQGSRYNGAGHDIRMELAGTHGTWIVGFTDRTPAELADQGSIAITGTPWPNFWERFTPAYTAEINAFVEVARGDRESPCTVEDGVEAFYIAEAATMSRLEHRIVSLDEVRAA